MAKKLITNEKGMSLVEVMVATAISVALGVGVMKINHSAQMGITAVKADNNIEDLRIKLKQRFDDEQNCLETRYNGSNTLENLTLSTSSTTSLSKIETKIAIDASSGPELEVGERVTFVAHTFEVVSITMEAFNPGSGGSVGSCDLDIRLRKFNADKTIGGVDRKVVIPMSCMVDGSMKITSCKSIIDSSSEGHWRSNEIGSTGDNYILYSGLVGDARVKIGAAGEITDSEVNAALTLDPGSASTVGGRRHAIQITDNGAISWGDGTSPGLNLYGTSNTIYSNNNFLANNYITAGVKVTSPEGYIQTLHSDIIQVNKVESERADIENVYAENVVSTTLNAPTINTENGNISYVVASSVGAYSYTTYSDKRLKKDIEEATEYSEKLSDLMGVTYFMRRDEFPEKNMPEARQFGLIAQDVQKVFPNLVKSNDDGYLSVNYNGLISLLIDQSNKQKDELAKNKEMLSVMQNGITNVSYTLSKHEERIKILENENKELKEELKEIKVKLNKILLYHKED